MIRPRPCRLCLNRVASLDHFCHHVIGGQGAFDLQVAVRLPRHVIQKGAHAGLGLQPDQVIAAQRPHDHLMIGQCDQDVGWRHRRMQEKADPILDAQLAQFARQRNQMIIMHPNQIVRPNHRPEHLREIFVDRDIALELGAMKFDQPELVMQQRPQRAVGVTQIIFLIIRPAEIDRGESDVAAPRNLGGVGPGFGGLARPAEPDTAFRPQRLADCRLEAAGAQGAGAGRPDPVGNRDQSCQCVCSERREGERRAQRRQILPI